MKAEAEAEATAASSSNDVDADDCGSQHKKKATKKKLRQDVTLAKEGSCFRWQRNAAQAAAAAASVSLHKHTERRSLSLAAAAAAAAQPANFTSASGFRRSRRHAQLNSCFPETHVFISISYCLKYNFRLLTPSS